MFLEWLPFCFRGDYFPASGCRHREFGSMSAVGEYGYSYSSSGYELGGLSRCMSLLMFASNDVAPMNSGNRSTTLSVRCVQAFMVIFVVGVRC